MHEMAENQLCDGLTNKKTENLKEDENLIESLSFLSFIQDSRNLGLVTRGCPWSSSSCWWPFSPASFSSLLPSESNTLSAKVSNFYTNQTLPQTLLRLATAIVRNFAEKNFQLFKKLKQFSVAYYATLHPTMIPHRTNFSSFHFPFVSGLILGLRGLIWDLRGLFWGLRGLI